MSRARPDLVNAVELAERGATLECKIELPEMPRLVEAGALEGTRASGLLRFRLFEGRPLVRIKVDGVVVLSCQRCLKPCECTVSEDASLLVVSSDLGEIPGGYESLFDDPENLSLAGAIEEQLLLGLPLVPKHADIADCGATGEVEVALTREAATEDKQKPFANLRDLLDEHER